MPRELGEKSQLILAALRAHGEPMDGDEVAAAIGDTEEGAALRVKALLRNLLGRGLVMQPGRGLWLATEEGTSAIPRRSLDDDAPDADDGTPRRVHRDAATTAALLKQQRLAPAAGSIDDASMDEWSRASAHAIAADARRRNGGRRGPKNATRIKVAAPKVAAPAIAAHEESVNEDRYGNDDSTQDHGIPPTERGRRRPHERGQGAG